MIVTARKHEESLQEMLISIAAFSAEQRQTTTIADISRMTPNLSLESTANNGGTSKSTNVFIRGVGQTDFTLTVDPGMGIYLNGVYISRSVGSLLDTADNERGRLSLRGDWFYKRERYLDAIDSPVLFQEGNDLVSASLAFVIADGRWSVSGGATNLTDSMYLLSNYQGLDAIGGAIGTFSPPREWLARVGMKF